MVKALQQLMEWRKENAAQLPSLAGEAKAMGREMARDIRSKLSEVFFGAPETASEPGTPMSPTQFQVNQTLDVKKEMDKEL